MRALTKIWRCADRRSGSRRRAGLGPGQRRVEHPKIPSTVGEEFKRRAKFARMVHLRPHHVVQALAVASQHPKTTTTDTPRPTGHRSTSRAIPSDMTAYAQKRSAHTVRCSFLPVSTRATATPRPGQLPMPPPERGRLAPPLRHRRNHPFQHCPQGACRRVPASLRFQSPRAPSSRKAECVFTFYGTIRNQFFQITGRESQARQHLCRMFAISRRITAHGAQ